MELGDIFYCIVVSIAMMIAVSIYLNEKRAGVSAAPTIPAIRRIVIKLLTKHSGLNRHLNIGELGSGWGGLAIKIANAFPNALITGFEISPCPRLISRIMTMFNPRVIILNKDFYEHDLSQFDALICYLSPKHMETLEKTLNTMHKKPLVISCSFSMPNTVPDEIIIIRQFINISVYVYHSRR